MNENGFAGDERAVLLPALAHMDAAWRSVMVQKIQDQG